MDQRAQTARRRLRLTLGRPLGATIVAAVAAATLVPVSPALAAGETNFATSPVAGELNPIAIEVVKATGALKNTITDGVKDGLGRRGLFVLEGLAPTAGIGVNEASYVSDSVVGKQWKPKYGWDYDSVLENDPGRIEDAPGGLRVGSGTDRLERDADGLHSVTQLDDAVVDIEKLSDDAAAVLGLTGDDAEILTADRITTTAVSVDEAVPSTSTKVLGLTILGEDIEIADDLLTESITRTHSVESQDVVALLRGLGVDAEDIDTYAPLVGSSSLAAELAVTASPAESGGLDVTLDVEVDLAAVSAGDEDTPAGALFNVELHADNTIVTANFGGTEITDAPIDPPTVSELSPLAATAGALVTVQGSNFVQDGTSVTVGGVEATEVAVLNDGTTLTFLVPEGAAGADLPVVVKTRGGQADAGSLTVSAPIRITEQPKDLTIDAGQDAVFTTKASGHPAPTVQWQFRTALGGEWSNISGDSFPSAITDTLTLPAEIAWSGLQLRAVFSAGGIDLASDSAKLTVNAITVPVDSDVAALASPVKVGSVALILSGQASGGTFAGLINGELSKGVELGEPGRFVLTESGTPAPGKSVRAEYPAGSTATGSGIGDLAAGLSFGPVTVENTHDGEKILSTSTVESFLLTDDALDDKGRIGAVAELDHLVEASNVTTTVTAPAGEQPTTAEATIGSLKIFGEELTAADGFVDGKITEPITKSYTKTITDLPAVLESLNLDISAYFEDPSELQGEASVEVEVTVAQGTETKEDIATASGLIATGKVHLALLLEPVGTAAAFVKRVEISSDGLGEMFNIELANTAVARNGAELPKPGESEGPEPEEPVEPEEPLPFVSYKPTETPDRVILNPTDTTETSQNITWRTVDSVTSGTVEYWPTEAGSTAKKTVQATTGGVFTASSDDEGQYTSRSHSATLTELSADTAYTYRVGIEGAWSEQFTFTTAGGDQQLEFMYLGDAQNDLRRYWEPAVKKAYEQLSDVELVLNAGDQINHADVDNEWGEWFGAVPKSLAEVNQLMVVGNHEYGSGTLGATWRQSYTLPQNGPSITSEPGTCDYVYERKMTASMKDVVYYTDYQGVRFVTLAGTTQAGELLPSSGELAGVTCAEDFNFLDKWFEIQAEWLDEVLAENPGQWSVVSIHQPIFSTSEGRDNTHLRDLLLPTIEKHNVDLVLQGHDHTYGRGHLASNDVSGKKGLQTGPVYVVSVLGPKAYVLDKSENNDWVENGAERVTAYENVRTYQDIKIDGGRLTYEAIEWSSGNVVDAFEICKSPDGTKVATKTAGADLPDNCEVDSGLTNSEAPEVLGAAEVGNKLQADRGTWSESGLSFEYQWLRNGEEIAGATERSYQVTSADLGALLSVRVTASKDGKHASAESAATAKVIAGGFRNTEVPTITGSARVGQTLQTSGGSWNQEASYSYQWLADGAEIAGANQDRLALTAAQLDKQISVVVTATAASYPAVSVESTSSNTVTQGALQSILDPLIQGEMRVGEKLTATPGVWAVNVSGVGFQWLRDGKRITDASDAHYEVTAADLGTAISVEVRPVAAGYVGVKTIYSDQLVARGVLESATAPAITGTAKVGAKLQAKPGTWNAASPTLAYQWLRSGKAIAKATGATYAVTAADAGKAISVRVTAVKPGYDSATATSKATKKVAKGSLKAKSVKITGKAAAGKTLKAAVKWPVSGVKAKYVWTVNGKTVQSGSKASYKVKASDSGKRIAVKVTGKKAGYVSVVKKSSAKKIAKR